MATVYRAYQPNLAREVAIKVMSSQFTDDETFVARFRREALAISRLKHPNILSIYDSGQEGATPYIVTELLDGKTLRERMGQPIELKAAANYLRQLASALDYAHEHGIIHRDVKPSNVLMGDQNRVVLSDFGIVKLLEGGNTLTATGFGVGTPDYMSPEQGTGEKLDGRSDQYALGVVLYEMLTGVTPFRGDTPLVVMMGHVNKPLPDPRQFNTRLTPQIVAVLTKVLSKRPTDRYRTCTEFTDAFEQAISPTTQNWAPATQPEMPTQVTVSPAITPQQAYQYALDKERMGAYQTAFETLVDLQRVNPNFADVPQRLARYQQMNYRYTGAQTLYKTGLVSSTDATQVSNTPSAELRNYQPPVSTAATEVRPFANQYTPPPISQTPAGGYQYQQPKKSNGGLIAVLIAGAVVIIGGIVVAMLLLTGNKPDPTKQASLSPAVTVATTTATTTQSATTNVPVTTAVLTTAPPATTAVVSTTAVGPKDPAATQVQDLSSKLYNGQADFKTTIDKLRAVVRQFPNSWLASRELGIALYLWNREAGEDVALANAIKLNDKDAKSHAYLAMVYHDGYNSEKALTEATRAIELDPKDPDARAAYSMALGGAGSGTDRSLTEAKKALDLDSNALWPRWAAFLASLDAGQNDEALTHINFLIGKFSSMATFYSAKGGLYRDQSDYDNAKIWYDKALAIDPQYPYAHSGLGWIYYYQENYDKSLAEFVAATKANDSYDAGHTGAGYALSAKSRYDEAIDQFKRAIQINVKAIDAYNGMAFTFIYKGDAAKDTNQRNQFYNQAIESADNALKYLPTYIDATFNKGRALYSLNRYTEAEPLLKKVIENRPKSSFYRIVLAYNYYAQKKYAESKTEAQEILKNDPSYTRASQLLDDIKKATGS